MNLCPMSVILLWETQHDEKCNLTNLNSFPIQLDNSVEIIENV